MIYKIITSLITIITIAFIISLSGCVGEKATENPPQKASLEKLNESNVTTTWNLSFLYGSRDDATNQQVNKDVLFQTSTIDALLEGVYDGDTTFGELKKHGDFGLGTVNGLDGEMLELDGKAYQIKTDGVAYAVNDSMKTPFAVVTFFEPDKKLFLNTTMNSSQFPDYLESKFPTKNIIYAIKIKGNFEYIKTRSVPGQKKPYPKLVEVTKNQSTFEFHKANGTIIGFWLPVYMKGTNVPGYHFHFITDDRTAGGHVLEYILGNSSIEIDYTSDFLMELPGTEEFYKVNLEEDKQAELEKVEK
ncbi:MAG: acetolactate decarboxylase [Candidatus Methanoperedens sp.]|nr:acetolactate decarboxylase [Candidatus Methanoperedens sp.]